MQARRLVFVSDQRHAAERLPVAEGGNSDRLDTGFWSAVETELDGLYGADGPAASGRGSAAMIQYVLICMHNIAY